MKITHVAWVLALLSPSLGADVDPPRGVRDKRHLRGLQGMTDLGGAGGPGDLDLAALAVGAGGAGGLGLSSDLEAADFALAQDLGLSGAPATDGTDLDVARAGADPNAIDQGGSASPGGSATDEPPSGSHHGAPPGAPGEPGSKRPSPRQLDSCAQEDQRCDTDVAFGQGNCCEGLVCWYGAETCGPVGELVYECLDATDADIPCNNPVIGCCAGLECRADGACVEAGTARGELAVGSRPEPPHIPGHHDTSQGTNDMVPGESEIEREVVCDLMRITSVSIHGTSQGEGITFCMHTENDMQIQYRIDEHSFPYGTFRHIIDISSMTLTMSNATVTQEADHGGGTISLGPGAEFEIERINREDVGLRGSSTGNERRLTEGDRTVLVLYAVPPDKSIARTSAQLANDIFGIHAEGEEQDLVNVYSQLRACSGGRLDLIPACGTEDQMCDNAPVVNGILEVRINEAISGLEYWQVGNLMRAAAQVILEDSGIYMWDFDHIMHIMPDDDSWGSTAGAASRPGRLTWFPSQHANSMGVLVHELGHNLGLVHSGFNVGQYADHSCLMGNPSFGDDGPAICFNGAKSWELGWYADDSKLVVPSSEAGYSAELIGVGDWSEGRHTSGSHKVVLKIEDSSEALAYYVMYNRATGPNAGVTFGRDKVTIVKGAPDQISWYQAELGTPAAGDDPIFRKPGFNGESIDLVIKVCAMNVTDPDTATVLVYLEDRAAWNDGRMRCPGDPGCLSDDDCEDGNACTRNTCDIPSGTCSRPVDISAEICATCGNQTFCNPIGDIRCRGVCDDHNACTNDTCSSESCLNEPIDGCSIPGALLETWLDIQGDDVSFLTENVAYRRGFPDAREIVDHLETADNRGSNYGARIRAYLVPPSDGEYTFYISSDASSELWLAYGPQERKELIASVNGWTGPQEWDKYTSQESNKTSLNGGSSYFLEALHKAGNDGDNFAVAWKRNDESQPNVIAQEYFFQHPPVPSRPDSEGILQLQPGRTFSKRGNRRSCDLNQCPSSFWHWLGVDCDCINEGAGRVDSCYTDGAESTVAFFDRAKLIPDPPTKYRLAAVGEDINELDLGEGGDLLSAVECYDHPLRGGFNIDLAGTGYIFAEGSTVRVWGWSASMRVKVDGRDICTEYNWYQGIDRICPIPNGIFLEVNCGGYGGDCSSEIFVTHNYMEKPQLYEEESS